MGSSRPAPRPRRSISRHEVTIALAIGLAGLVLGWILLCRKRAPALVPPPPILVQSSPPRPPPAGPSPPAEVLTRATLHCATEVSSGAVIDVRWSGPDNPDDFVTLVRSDAPVSEFGPTQPTRTGDELKFTAPDEPGECELRYVAGRSKRILGTHQVRILPVTAEITAASQAVLGTRIMVNWHGPGGSGDRLTIVPSEISDAIVDHAVSAEAGSPVEMVVPVDPGSAEIRYVSGSNRVLARHPILITIPVTTLQAPEAVSAGCRFEIQWRGPDSPADVVALVPKGAPEGLRGNCVPTSTGSTLILEAPADPGPMELRYVTGSKALTLARRPLEVTRP